jgi:hypothetical protein
LLLLTVVYFWRQVIEGQALYWGDIGLYFTPMQVFLKQNLDAGRLPLWNPLILCGTPYVGNPQTWPLYPATALLPFVSAPQFENLTVALHVWLAGLGTYAFARRALRVGTGPALLAAITFMFGGQFVSKEQFPNMVQAAAWLPWVLVCLDSLLRRKRFQDALALGFILGLQLLAAHVQMTLLTLYLAAAYGIFISAGRSWRGTGPLLLLSLVIGSGLAMGQILPTLALFRDAARHKLSFAVVDRFYLPFNQLGNFVLPHLHGNPYFGNWTARGNIWETCCYVGLLPFGLALWGGIAAFRLKSRMARFWVGVFFAALWMAFGGHGGLYHLAYFVLPGFRSFHDPARCLLWACFALSLLGAFGLERVLMGRATQVAATKAQSPPARTPILTCEGRFRELVAAILIARQKTPVRNCIAAVILLFAFADLAHFGQTLYPLANPAALFPAAPNIALVQRDPDMQAHQARILAPTEGVWLRFTNYKDFRQSVPGYQTRWADTLTPNLTMPYGLRDAFGYEPVALKNIESAASHAAQAFNPKASAKERADAAAWGGALGVKYVAICQITPLKETLPGLVGVRTTPILAPPGDKYKTKAVMSLSRDTKWQPRAHLEHSTFAVKLTDEGPDCVRLTFRTTAPDRLILEDTQAAGWQASLDGQRVPIATDDHCLRAISVPIGGPHRVVFTYLPTPFRLGLYLSLLTLAGLLGTVSFSMARKLGAQEGFRRRRAE